MRQDMHLGIRRSSRLTSPDDHYPYYDTRTERDRSDLEVRTDRDRSGRSMGTDGDYSGPKDQASSPELKNQGRLITSRWRVCFCSNFELRSPKSELRPKDITMVGVPRPSGNTPRKLVGSRLRIKKGYQKESRQRVIKVKL